MQIIIRCPHCNHIRSANSDIAGLRIACRNCRFVFKVPAIEELRRGISTIKHANCRVFVDKEGNIYG